jgi:hypothetical protein
MHFTLSVRAVSEASQCFTQAGTSPWSIAAVVVLLTVRDVVGNRSLPLPTSKVKSREQCFGVKTREVATDRIGSLGSSRSRKLRAFLNRHLLRRVSPLNLTTRLSFVSDTSESHASITSTPMLFHASMLMSRNVFARFFGLCTAMRAYLLQISRTSQTFVQVRER